jgi:hypothetical protein
MRHILVVFLLLIPFEPPPHREFTDEDYAEHVAMLEREQIPKGRGFHVVIEKPFVVVGDESAGTVRRRATETVQWSVERIKKEYFDRDPEAIYTIWLFKDRESYERHAREIFGEEPDTPFGYASRARRALVMNIATGGGTLVHEIVHPFLEANFPDCPAWFNEGLASLYEQSGDRDGRIVGRTNWRLRGLQDAIREKRLPSFRRLTSSSTSGFYNEDRGTHYAQARYLCYYLQEKGLLRDYYRRFVKNHAGDPTGYETLRTVLVEEDMDAFQRKWEAWVLELRFPERH